MTMRPNIGREQTICAAPLRSATAHLRRHSRIWDCSAGRRRRRRKGPTRAGMIAPCRPHRSPSSITAAPPPPPLLRSVLRRRSPGGRIAIHVPLMPARTLGVRCRPRQSTPTQCPRRHVAWNFMLPGGMQPAHNSSRNVEEGHGGDCRDRAQRQGRRHRSLSLSEGERHRACVERACR